MAVLGLAGPGWAEVPPGAACVAAGHAAEQQAFLPRNLLISIGMVESAHPDPLTGQDVPWPWTVNADGQGRYFPTEAAAAAFVRFAEASGARDIDVGCFQVSLESHPDAFATLDEAFDPARNAAYAARFLMQLKRRTGAWNTAIANYHSALPDMGLPYERRVLSAWRRLGDVPFAFGGDMAQSGYSAPDATVILQTAAARHVHVYSMLVDGGVPVRPGLPRVVDGN